MTTATTAHVSAVNRKFVVCPTCEGEGQTGPGWVYTAEDRDEMGEEWYDHMDDMREGRFNVVCDECKGQRVVRAECACEDCEQERAEEAEDRYISMMEQRMGC